MKQPEFYGSTTISDKGQVVIPVEARTAMGFEKGEKLLVLGMGTHGLMLTRLSEFEEMSAKMDERRSQIQEIIKKEKK